MRQTKCEITKDCLHVNGYIDTLKKGLLMKLPSMVATKISTTVRGLNPTSENAKPITPKKIKPTTTAKITKSTAKRK
jgi:hypothetical protein